MNSLTKDLAGTKSPEFFISTRRTRIPGVALTIKVDCGKKEETAMIPAEIETIYQVAAQVSSAAEV